MANVASSRPIVTAVGAAPKAASLLEAAFKDAGLAAIITALLAFPLIAYRTVEAQTTLDLVGRWPVYLIIIGIIFVVRLGTVLVGGMNAGRSTTAKAVPKAGAQPTLMMVVGRYLAPAVVGFAAILPLTPFADRYILDLGILVLTYVMLGWGLNIVVGLAGLLDLGYVAFYAVGAYSYALLAQHFGFSFWICLPLAGILAALWGVILGFPVLRLRGDYLAIVTLAFGEIIRTILINWAPVTGGPNGLSGIPRPSFFGYEFKNDCGPGTFCGLFGVAYDPTQRIVFLYYLILALCMLTNFVTMRLRRLPVGRAWEALREDEIACRALGINTTTTKLSAFATGAMFAGFAGSFFATKQGFISPESFVFMESAIILAIVVLGGMGSQIGTALAALAMTAGLELFRNLGFLKQVFGEEFDPTQYRMLVFGLAMVVVMVLRPRGFVGNREPSIFLKEHKSIAGDLVKEGH